MENDKLNNSLVDRELNPLYQTCIELYNILVDLSKENNGEFDENGDVILFIANLFNFDYNDVCKDLNIEECNCSECTCKDKKNNENNNNINLN